MSTNIYVCVCGSCVCECVSTGVWQLLKRAQQRLGRHACRTSVPTLIVRVCVLEGHKNGKQMWSMLSHTFTHTHLPRAWRHRLPSESATTHPPTQRQQQRVLGDCSSSKLRTGLGMPRRSPVACAESIARCMAASTLSYINLVRIGRGGCRHTRTHREQCMLLQPALAVRGPLCTLQTTNTHTHACTRPKSCRTETQRPWLGSQGKQDAPY